MYTAKKKSPNQLDCSAHFDKIQMIIQFKIPTILDIFLLFNTILISNEEDNNKLKSVETTLFLISLKV